MADIDGVITRRNVNPGNNVQAGEGLMAIRSLTDIWVDANFKETQLANLRIGQKADLEVDMYGRHKTFHGVISGFTMGTGSTLALLPAENATGNFIKVVQRLPVRIDLTDYDPNTDPLFVGLSVVPYVWYKEKPADVPNAGELLRPLMSDLPSGKVPRDSAGSAGRQRGPRQLAICLGAESVATAEQAGKRTENGSPAGDRAVTSVAIPVATSRPAINPWLVASVVVVPTFMEVLDTTIANVALRYIAGGLSAAVIDSEWVITSYLAANATILPISGWLSARLGRRNYFMLSIAVFTISSGLCGIRDQPQSVDPLPCPAGAGGRRFAAQQPGRPARCLSAGEAGSGDDHVRRGRAFGPVVGPTLGGYLTDNYNWRWIFYINLPVGTVALVACYFLLDDPRLPQGRAGGAAETTAEFRLHRLRPFGPHDVVVGDHAQQGAAVGLVGRCVLARADVACAVRRRPDPPDHPRNADQESRRQFSTARRTELRRVLHHHLLRLRGALRPRARRFPPCCRRFSDTTPTTRGSCCRRQASRRLPVAPRGRQLLGRGVDARWFIAAGLIVLGERQLLDVAHESADQPLAGRLAAGGCDRRPVDDLRSAECRGLSIHAAAPLRRRSDCSPFCVTKGAASAPPSRRRSRSGASNSTPCAWASTSIDSIPQ